jgi:hypothetical protein
MSASSSRLANVLAAWIVLAAVALISVGLMAAFDQERPADSGMPLTHWLLRLDGGGSPDDRDEAETRPKRLAPGAHDPSAGGGAVDLLD